MKAMKGTANETAVSSTESLSFDRTHTVMNPATRPIAIATVTAKKKSPTTPQNDTAAAVAATAERNSTSAVASLTRLSPSRIVTSRGGRPSFLPSAVAATASVGLITAPIATHAANDS